ATLPAPKMMRIMVPRNSENISLPNDEFAVAKGADTVQINPMEVQVYKGINLTLIEKFSAFGSSFRGGLRVAVGDIDADGVSDYVVGSGPGANQMIRGFKGTVSTWSSDKAFPTVLFETTSGLGADGDNMALAVGDVSGDGMVDIAVASGCGASIPRVRVLDGANPTKVLVDFEVPMATRSGIASIGVADMNSDSYGDVVVSFCNSSAFQGFSGKSIVDSRKANEVNQQVPTSILSATADSTSSVPVDLALGDFNHDGSFDLIAGFQAGSTGGAKAVRVFSGAAMGALLIQLPMMPAIPTGLSMASVDLNADGYWDAVAGAMNGSNAHQVEIHDGYGALTWGPGVWGKILSPFSGFTGGIRL
ncbi:VCBS repeat-containing protein, partial [bacterium]|nr:VCBS repeat-containing protein [bacterium]